MDNAKPGLYAVITEFIWPEQPPWVHFEKAVFDGRDTVPDTVRKLRSMQSCITSTLQQDDVTDCTAVYIRFPSVANGHGLLVGPTQDLTQEYCQNIFLGAMYQGYIRDRFSLIGIRFKAPHGAWEFFRGPSQNYCDMPEHARKRLHLPEPEWIGWRGMYVPGTDYEVADSKDYIDVSDTLLEYDQENNFF